MVVTGFVQTPSLFSLLLTNCALFLPLLLWFSCNNLNFARRSVCNRCNTPKPESEWSAPAPVGAPGGGRGRGGPPQARDGDWTCLYAICYSLFSCISCGNVNWARRTQCNKCGAPKPSTAGDSGGR